MFDWLIPEWSWAREALCGTLHWDRFGVGVSLTHWALPLFIRIDHQDCGHLDGWSVAIFCFAIFYNCDDCEECE